MIWCGLWVIYYGVLLGVAFVAWCLVRRSLHVDGIDVVVILDRRTARDVQERGLFPQPGGDA